MTRVATYLDHNAGAPTRPEAVEAMVAALAIGGNPSSVHRAGRLARRAIEEAREAVADLAGAEATEVIFTSGGTEANNLALLGAVRAGLVARLLVSGIEHDSVRAAAAGAGVPVAVIPVDRDGVVDLAALDRLLQAGQGPALVSVMLANNETGVIQPVAEVARIARAHGALVHTDGVQALGKTAFAFSALDADMMTVSAHKIGGPAGVGALVKRAGIDLVPLSLGGGQEYGRRPGTENLAGIAGFGAAARVARGLDLAALRDRLEREVLTSVPGVRIFGAGAARVGNTSCIGLDGVKAETQVMALDLAGVSIGAGAACSSGKVRPSPVLTAMGESEETARSAIRVSLGWNTAEADVTRFLSAYIEFAGRALKARADAGWKENHHG
ncbi:cysteine desulfurase family protein [Zavarzinia compransoris]|uniref:Cysteine desulfurase n=1 Tax=Zavarzinia compransoris TaxID=1264899 RepID=A0A317EB22_9PROT|nr:cysteine desulfurase family protein [Zavarzinia compransoris]PWR23752.1 cysteine desulfurase [Zavarzinia compransoris]TDP47980.1 cysteine desulfurase [Zavarzinia compransoris]